MSTGRRLDLLDTDALRCLKNYSIQSINMSTRVAYFGILGILETDIVYEDALWLPFHNLERTSPNW